MTVFPSPFFRADLQMTFLDLGVLNVLKVGTDALISNQQNHVKITMLDFRITQNLILLHVDDVLNQGIFSLFVMDFISLCYVLFHTAGVD